MASIFLRSLVFNIFFYLVFLFWAVIALPTFVLPRKAMLTVANWWAQTYILLLRVVCNIKVEFRGVDKIPKGPLIVASKHQSMWETISLLHFFEAPFFALKRELMFIPLFGLFLIKTRMIAIDRRAGGRALIVMARRARQEVLQGRQFVIFPEGTRSPTGETGTFKSGLYYLARERNDVELVPVFMENLNRILPKGSILPVPLLGGVTIGAPIRLDADEEKSDFLARARGAVLSLHTL